ncbi:MAG: cytochrome d ubiquinol oxidase subunit II [Ignavibacteriae bacterium]|nr:MAG: cytochrome d ubiquinol oxidase subunit II [Ignavibacteriota bacterium]
MDLNTIWFWLVALLIMGYAILDGFDFGVGILSLFGRDENERRIHFNAIGPVWDGNEVWLITGGGALFAAFPAVYATVFSGFYIALMLLLAALIFRAVSFEFRNKVDSAIWRRTWDWAFGLGSLFPAILFGVAVGNILRGVPIDVNGRYLGTFLGLLNPYSIGVGVLSLVLFTMHGAIYLAAKSQGDLRIRCQKWASHLWMDYVILYVIITLWTWIASPYLFEHISGNPVFYIFLVMFAGSTTCLPIFLKAEKYFLAFLASSLIIVSMLGQMALSLYPRFVPSSLDLNYSLTIYNSSSSTLTLQTMLIIALIGMPIVIVYSLFIHVIFRGKVEITEESY